MTETTKVRIHVAATFGIFAVGVYMVQRGYPWYGSLLIGRAALEVALWQPPRDDAA